MKIQRILVPVDFSERTEAAFCAALDLSRPLGAEVIVLHVVAPPSPIRLALDAHLGRPLPHASESELLAARDHMDALIAIAPHHDVRVHPRVEVGDPAATSVRIAVEERVDLILLATRNRTGLLHRASVARTLLGSAPCPVFVLREHATAGTSRANSHEHAFR
jgi:nucleotide-binding universal stress UspA family protein